MQAKPLQLLLKDLKEELITLSLQSSLTKKLRTCKMRKIRETQKEFLNLRCVCFINKFSSRFRDISHQLARLFSKLFRGLTSEEMEEFQNQSCSNFSQTVECI